MGSTPFGNIFLVRDHNVRTTGQPTKFHLIYENGQKFHTHKVKTETAGQ